MSAQMLSDLVMLGALPLLLAASAFFSGCETALFSLSGHQRLALSRQSSMVAGATMALLAETRSLLITLLLGNMTVNVLYFVISTVLLIRLTELHHASATLVTVLSVAPLLALILCGEVLPKLLAARVAMGWVTVMVLPLWVVHRGIGPLRVLLQALVVTPLARLISPPEQPPKLSARELQTLLELSEKRGVIDPDEESLLQGVLELGRLRVKDVMTPRVDLKAFDASRPVAELIELLRATRLSRVPVYRGSLDNIQGVAFARQVLLTQPKDQAELEPLIRQVVFVPELQRCDQLLVQFRKRGTTLAVAVDEYGGTAGVISLEDVVEQMVGQIAGPFHSGPPAQVQKLGPGVWQAPAQLPLRDWADLLELPDTTRGVATLGGLVMSHLGRVPRLGDRIKIGNVSVEVDQMRGRRVASLMLRLEQPTGDEANDSGEPQP